MIGTRACADTPGTYPRGQDSAESKRLGPASNGTGGARGARAGESWMPDHERMGATPARVTGYLGGGRYRVEGLRRDGCSWCNVRLTVASSSATDSLAFNTVC